jgi:alpha-glucoside transport system substrate-binding protein
MQGLPHGAQIVGQQRSRWQTSDRRFWIQEVRMRHFITLAVASRWMIATSLALLLTVALASGCGGKKSGTKGTISIIAKWTGDEQASFEAVLAPFEKANPDVTIKYQGAGDDTPQVVSTAVEGGNPPDIATMPQPGTMADFAKRGALKPITFAKDDIEKHYAPVWLQLGAAPRPISKRSSRS